LDKPTGDITVEDMENLTELDASVWARGFMGYPWGGSPPPIESLS
jgi:hypothetical protein